MPWSQARPPLPGPSFTLPSAPGRYGLEFIRFALRRLWLGEQGAAYLRGYSVAHVFEGHVKGLSDGTKK